MDFNTRLCAYIVFNCYNEIFEGVNYKLENVAVGITFIKNNRETVPSLKL